MHMQTGRWVIDMYGTDTENGGGRQVQVDRVGQT